MDKWRNDSFIANLVPAITLILPKLTNLNYDVDILVVFQKISKGNFISNASFYKYDTMSQKKCCN